MKFAKIATVALLTAAPVMASAQEQQADPFVSTSLLAQNVPLTWFLASIVIVGGPLIVQDNDNDSKGGGFFSGPTGTN